MSPLRTIAKCDIFYCVRVISAKPLREFANKHADAKKPLGVWLKLAEHGAFRNLTELKQTFGGVDMVSVKQREFYVFNIGGNKYRLVAAVHFNTQMLFVRHVLTHAEYDAEGWKK
jgi:mRNA interferase HigB